MSTDGIINEKTSRNHKTRYAQSIIEGDHFFDGCFLVKGRFDEYRDIDCYRIKFNDPGIVKLKLTTEDPSMLDGIEITIWDNYDSSVAYVDNPDYGPIEITTFLEGDTYYYVEIQSFDDKPAQNNYDLEITQIEKIDFDRFEEHGYTRSDNALLIQPKERLIGEASSNYNYYKIQFNESGTAVFKVQPLFDDLDVYVKIYKGNSSISHGNNYVCTVRKSDVYYIAVKYKGSDDDYGNLVSKKGHGYYLLNVDLPESLESKLSKADEFVKIIKGSTVYYGGNQDWYYPNEIGREGGCGPTAAANILAYLALMNPNLRKLYKYSTSYITISDFTKHMNEVYEYVTPLKVPELIANAEPFGYKVPKTLGVTTLEGFVNDVEKFAKSRGVNLRGHWSYKLPTFKNAVEYVKEALEKDSPVALLNYWNSDLANIKFTDETGMQHTENFQLHWVTITSLTENLKTGEVSIEVSSWGGRATLDFKDVVNSPGFGGIIYFESY